MTPPHRLHHVVRAKVGPAPLPEGLILRPRVLRHLSVGHRFTLVSAMAGYGKTAAVRQWIEEVDVPVAWLSLDLLDRAPRSFWSNLLLALGTAVPGIDAEPAMLLWERGVDDTLFLAALIAELSELAPPVVLVLDGLSEHLDQAVLDGLSLLVDRGGDTLRIVATTRSDPGLPTARWSALGWLNVVREDILRLTDDEALAMAERTQTAIRDPEEVIDLSHRVDRWPIGLHMALLSRPVDSSLSSPASRSIGSNRLLANYLVAEVLDAMSDQERSVALKLCVLRQFDPEICAQLAGPEAADAVRRLLRRGMFLSVIDASVGSMRFHDLFRELMETELGYRDPIGRVYLHRRAAMLWRERGDLLSVYHHLAVIGETGEARELLMGPTLVLLDDGDLNGLRRLARQLPVPQDITNPDLALDLGVVALYADGTLAARRWCERAITLLRDRSQVELEPRLLALECSVALMEADLETALAVIDHQPRSRSRSADVFEQRLPIAAARVMLAARRDTDADEWISLAEAVRGPEIVTEVTVPTLRAWHEWLFGSSRRAVLLIDRALTWLDDRDVGHHPLGFDTLVTGAWCRLGVGDITDAWRLAERAHAQAKSFACAWNQLQVGHLRARLALITGEPSRALKIVDELGDAVQFDSCPHHADRLRGIEIEALAASGRSREAVARITELQDGPRAQLLRARLTATTDREVDRLLAAHSSWPGYERLQAEVILNTRHAAPPSTKLIELVARCAEDGWVLPFLDLGSRVEARLRDLPLGAVHPQLERTLLYLAPTLPADAERRSGMRLTSRELSLVELLPTHLSNAEIGAHLYLSVNTIKSNLKALYRKLDATTRAEAVDAAKRAGLI